MKQFNADGHATLIGSFPLHDHGEALAQILAYTPAIPCWPQLPVYPNEGMVLQFVPGFPGLTRQGEKVFVDTRPPDFEADLLTFYEAYMAACEQPALNEEVRFALDREVSKGFFELKAHLEKTSLPPAAVKCQITGPFTFASRLADQDGRAVFYNDQLRDAAVKLIALKARWQVERLAKFDVPVIVFFDEPALAGFGSSEFISVSKDDIVACLKEVAETVAAAGALAGVHVCANTDWSLAFEAGLDIINFDTYGYFDRFVLYGNQIKTFLADGGILAWGIVPTSGAETIQNESGDSLTQKWRQQAAEIEKLGVAPETIRAQSLITPSCGMGSLQLDLTQKVLSLTKYVSDQIRKTYPQ